MIIITKYDTHTRGSHPLQYQTGALGSPGCCVLGISNGDSDWKNNTPGVLGIGTCCTHKKKLVSSIV